MTKLSVLLGFCIVLSACSSTQSIPDEPLVDRYWRAIEIAGVPVFVPNHRAEPHVVLAADLKAHGSDGCNRFNGQYASAPGLRFGPLASTRMACIPPLDAVARDFTSALSKTANYRISGRQLELLDIEGCLLMRLEATALIR